MFGATFVLAKIYERQLAYAQRDFPLAHPDMEAVHSCYPCHVAASERLRAWLNMATMASDMNHVNAALWYGVQLTDKGAKPFVARIRP